MLTGLVKRIRQRLKSKMGKPTDKPKGKSAKRGNAPAPYTKYQKRPYKYGHKWNGHAFVRAGDRDYNDEFKPRRAA